MSKQSKQLSERPASGNTRVTVVQTGSDDGPQEVRTTVKEVTEVTPDEEGALITKQTKYTVRETKLIQDDKSIDEGSNSKNSRGTSKRLSQSDDEDTLLQKIQVEDSLAKQQQLLEQQQRQQLQIRQKNLRKQQQEKSQPEELKKGPKSKKRSMVLRSAMGSFFSELALMKEMKQMKRTSKDSVFAGSILSACNQDLTDMCILCGAGLATSRCLECNTQAHNRCIEAFMCPVGETPDFCNWTCPKCVTLEYLADRKKQFGLNIRDKTQSVKPVKGSCLWCIVWFFILIFFAIWFSIICIPLYVFASCLEGCSRDKTMREFSRCLLKCIQFPNYCTKNMCYCTSMYYQ